MQNATVEHPSRAELEAYGLGLQSAPVAEAIERHLTACPPCVRVLETVPDDLLITLLRPPMETAACVAPGADSPPRAVPNSPGAADVPPELTVHPRYRIRERLGAGGMGAVYKAEHRLMNQVVALKVIHRHMVHDAQARERFLREIKAVAGLAHPNIVKALDAEESAGLLFLVMDYVEGTTLARLVEERGALPVDRACDYVRQAALGLQHAFERGIIHRDLKPQNLMLVRPADAPQGERVLVLDFGLARFLREGEAALTHSGTALGTPDYIAPEQATDARRADVRSDIYSLGCTLYFLLAGHPPFPDGTSVEKLLAHLCKKPRPLAELRADLPPGLPQIVERMMAQDPAARHQTPGDVAAALAPFVMAAPAVAPVRRPRRWLPIAAAGVGAACVAVGVIVACLLGLPGGQDGPRGGEDGRIANKGAEPAKEPLQPAPPSAKEKAPLRPAPPPAKPAPVGLVRQYIGHKSGARSVAFSPDGKSFLSGGFCEVFLWDVESQAERRRFPEVHGWAHSVAFSPDGERALAGGQAGFVKEWEVKTGKIRHILERRITAVESVAFIPRQPYWLYSGLGGVRLYDPEKKEEAPRRFLGERASLGSDGRRLLSADGRTLYLWDVETGQELGHAEHGGQILCLALAPDGRRAVSGGVDIMNDSAILYVWNMETGKQERVLKGHEGAVQAVAVSPDGRRALSGGRDRKLRLWDLATAAELHCFEGHTDAVVGVAFSPDGRRALSAGDKTVRLWQLPEPGPESR